MSCACRGAGTYTIPLLGTSGNGNFYLKREDPAEVGVVGQSEKETLRSTALRKPSATSANTQEGARLDIAANGLWEGRLERTYFDVRVFNPHAPSNRHTTPSACYRKHENLKKRAYQQRIREIEHSSFSPLVLSSTGGSRTCSHLNVQASGKSIIHQVGSIL